MYAGSKGSDLLRLSNIIEVDVVNKALSIPELYMLLAFYRTFVVTQIRYCHSSRKS